MIYFVFSVLYYYVVYYYELHCTIIISVLQVIMYYTAVLLYDSNVLLTVN